MIATPHAAPARPEITDDMGFTGMRTFFRIAETWQLSVEQAKILLGRPSKATFHRWKRGEGGALKHDTLQRLSYVLGIYRALQVLYSRPELADGWIKRPNAAFGGASALDRMLGGDVTDLAAARNYLDAVRGGW